VGKWFNNKLAGIARRSIGAVSPTSWGIAVLWVLIAGLDFGERGIF